ncbi:serine/threonine protein kinase [Gimesia panareensis]|uniref:serine/threonine protein kinase n=1 Tax=Gimesia panareensis TaxID=2527978 RepID=UPI0011894C67|nr:serine/threonine-protein kinase [Gimesia panareensis]QDU49523.1 Serine/threonine-protein kinase PrkC [Gimesia panareensis]
MNQPFELENLTAEIQCRIEECCEEYEASWQNGESPSLEKTLADFTPPTREILLKELILIERYYKLRDTGKIVSEQELIQQHPEIADELSRLFARSHATQTRIADESDSGLADSSGLRTVQESRLHFEQFPAQFGRYQILSRLGEGGMGCVYLARDTQLERKVALKLPQIDRHADPQFISRFYREARAAANLNHPNLCSVYDVDEIDGVHYITMEFIEGESLAALIQSGKQFSQREIAQLIQQLSQALDLAHQQGIVHRDLKPANIMIREDGSPIITDFGLALMSQNEETTQITHHGQIMGSPSYMSPEQVDGDLEKIGPPSDIYSLGVIMYELLAGQRPFQGSTASILSQIMTKDPRPVRNIQPDIDARLDQICRKMMSRSTEQRYETMQEVSQVLANWLETHQAVSARSRLSPVKLLVGMALVAGLLLGIIFLKPTASPGRLHVTLNDARAQVLLDGQPLDLKSGSWNGPQTPGSHELSLQIGDQRLPWGELTKVKSEGREQRVLASVNGVPLKNGRFEIAADSTESAEIKLSWLPVEQKTGENKSNVNKPVQNQLVTSKPTEPETKPTFDKQIAVEREIAEWVIGLGGKVHYMLADGTKVNGSRSADSVDNLPDDPFLVSEIKFDSPGKMKRTLPDMSRLNRLLALQVINISECTLEPGALSQLRFWNALEIIDVDHTSLKSSDLKTIRGLQFLDTFKISKAQIDDDFQFLEQMPHLRDLSLSETSLELLQRLARSPLLSHTKLRFLRIEFEGTVDNALIEQLQATRPGMTIIAIDQSNKPRYLGTPFARLAADRLLDLGCTIRGQDFNRISDFTKELRPSETIPFHAIEVTLPSDLVLTPQIVADLAQLPAFYGLTAHRIKNIDLLADVPVLKRCDGIYLKDSDLTDRGLEALAQRCPVGFIAIEGTQVTPEVLRRIDRNYPFLVLHSDFPKGHNWLRDQLPLPDSESVPSTSELTYDEQLALEREVAEWVLGLGGKVQCRLADEKKTIGSVDSLPDDPFLVTEITFNSTGNKKITLTDISRLNRLLGLQVLNLTDCTLEPGALSQLRFGNTLRTISIVHSSLKSSDLKTIRGLQFLDTFKIGNSQIDDDFQFLEQMPHLRALALGQTSLELLQKLAQSPFLPHTNLRFLRFEFDGKIDNALIEQLQTARPGLTIIASDLINNRRYLRIPYARLAVDRLLDLGCTIKGKEPNRAITDYTKELRPSGTGPFQRILEVTLPSGLKLTPQIVADLAQLSDFYGLVANQIQNADLLADAPVLKRCDGIHLIDSDLTDQGFAALVRLCPISYFNIKGTQVTRKLQQQIDRDYPLIVFHDNPHSGNIWLKDKLPFPDPESVPSTSEMTDEEQIAFERETAEWVIQLGGRVSLKKAKGVAQQVGRLDQLPAEPFRITDIDFSKSDQKITLPDLSRLSRLLTLHSLNIMNCHLEPGALEGLCFGESMTDLHIYNTPLKTSDLTAILGLEHLDTFKLGAIQVDDRFRFLELMPQLRDLLLYSPVQKTLEGLARAPGLKQSNLRFLNLVSDGRQFAPEIIAELQKVQPGMTVIDNDDSGHLRYLGIPVARQAAIILLKQGCTIKASKGKTYHQFLSPSETELFLPGRVILPPGLEITPEITMALAQLPRFFGLEADGVKNADLLADIPILKLCGGLHLKDSDLSDQGFEALIRNHPDGYVHAEGTRVTRKKAEQLDREFRYAAFHTDFLEGKRWLAVRETDEDKKPIPQTPKPPEPAQTEAAPFNTEREIAEWVIGLGGVREMQADSDRVENHTRTARNTIPVSHDRFSRLC